MNKGLFLFLYLMISSVYAASYSLPADIGNGPFSSCNGVGPTYPCSNDLNLGNNDDLTLTANVTLDINGDLDVGNGFQMFSNGNILTLNVNGDVDFGNVLNFNGNINATGDVDIGNSANFTGNITANGDVDIGNSGNFTGDITAGGNLDIGNNTVVNGVCSPIHSACTGVGGGGGASCVSFRDEFSSESYSRQDGSANWSSNWIETGDNNNASNGDIEISGGRLQLEGDGSGGGRAAFGNDPSIEREADLSAYSSATLTFNYFENGSWESSDEIQIWLSTDGGSSWGSGPVHTFVNDQGSTQQLFSQDISAFISASTRVALVENASASDEIFFFDNFQIEACSTGAPTVDAQTTSDTTPIITGSFNSADSAGGFSIQVNGVTYTLGSSSELTNIGDDWTLDLSAAPPLPIAIYDIVATSNDGAGNVLTDPTVDELEIIAPVCTATFRDEFTSASYSNNDGDVSFSGAWDEYEGTSASVPEASPNPNAGHVQVSGGQLVINNYSPETANSPGVERELDLSAYTSATLSFSFTTTGNVDTDDSILIQASSNGGTSWTLLENITGINDTTGSRSYNLTPFISSNTKIRLRVNNIINSGACCYGSAGETISFDNINIDATGACMSVDHYAISHGGIGVTCEAEAIVVTAHDAGDVAVAPLSTTAISLSTSLANDGWSLKSGNGTFTPPNQYRFDGVETSVEFWLRKTAATTAPHMDIDVSDGSATDPDDAGAEDPVLEFRDTALRFYADGSHNSIGTQIADKSSADAPGNQALTLRAVQTNSDTGACEARVTGTQTVQMSFDCVNPVTCKDSNGVSITDTTLAVASPITDVAPGSNVDLSFDASGTASWNLSYTDAGQIRLSAILDIAALGNDPADTLSGSSNVFTSKPAGLCVQVSAANADCASGDASCSAFRRAGENFNLNVQAVGWQNSSESDTDFCTGNAVTPNFALAAIGLGQSLVAPAGVAGTLGITSLDMVLADDGDHTVTNQTISEVGVFTFTATPPAYFGETIAASTSANVGRFYPGRFVLSVPQLVDRVDLGCASSFTYMDENFQLLYRLTAESFDNGGGTNTTGNYFGAFARLDAGELHYGAVDITGPTDLSARLSTSPTLNFINGQADVTDTVTLGRPLVTPPFFDGPYALSVGIAPLDDDGVQLDSYDLDVVAGGGNDHALIETTEIHYGRLVVANAFGSELRPLSINVRAQVYDSVTGLFRGNGLDQCSVYDVVNIDLASATYIAPLAFTNLGLSGSGQLISGSAQFSMHDETNPAEGPGVHGEVLYSMTVPSYLQFDWDGNNVYTDNPPAKASFGIFNGDSRQIYFRQIYP